MNSHRTNIYLISHTHSYSFIRILHLQWIVIIFTFIASYLILCWVRVCHNHIEISDVHIISQQVFRVRSYLSCKCKYKRCIYYIHIYHHVIHHIAMNIWVLYRAHVYNLYILYIMHVHVYTSGVFSCQLGFRHSGELTVTVPTSPPKQIWKQKIRLRFLVFILFLDISDPNTEKCKIKHLRV